MKDLEKKQKIAWRKLLNYYILAAMVGAAISAVVYMVQAPSQPDAAMPYNRLKSDYVLILAECILGIIAICIPTLLKNKFQIEVPSAMLLLYSVFLYCAIYLGEAKSFYYIVPHWDTVLHAFSGTMLGALGFSFVSLLNKTERIPMELSPLFVACFSFCFAITLGVIWEFYEFLADGVLGTNMQKFALEGGEDMVGRAALTDTMEDLFVNVMGAFVMSAIGYVSLKFKKGWIEKLQVRIGRKKKEEEA